MTPENYLVIAMFVTFILGLMTGFPIAWVLGGVGVLFAFIGYFADIYLGTFTGLDYFYLGLSVNRLWALLSNWVLVALPMFIFMGLTLDQSGIAERMMHAMQRLFGPVRGGLAVTVTAIGIILAASTGIIGASVVLLGLLSLPAMLAQGYSRPLALGTIAGAGTLGILIPPSIMLVIMGDQVGLSVGDLFMGALIPGVILGVMYIVYILIYAYFNPAAAPVSKDYEGFSFSALWEVILSVVPAALLIFTVLGSIFAGVATPTEASGVGAFGALILAACYRRLNLKVLHKILLDTYSTTGYIFGILLGATVFALVLRGLGGDQLIESALVSLPGGPYGIIAFILFSVFLLGFFLDWIEITLIILPLVAPVVGAMDLDINGFGVVDKPHLVWFVLLVAIALQTSFLTPPVGFALFYLKGVCPPDIKLVEIYKGVVPFIIIQLIALLLVAFFPELVTWLPAYAYGR